MTSKKKSKTKAAATKRRARTRPTAAPPKTAKASRKASSPTLAEVAQDFLAQHQERGSSATTLASYRADLGIAIRHFGADTRVGGISAKQLEAYNTSAAVTKTRAGKAKAKPGVERTRRVLRLALAWAAGGQIKKAPAPKAKR